MCLSPWMITESRKVHVFPSKLKPTTSVSNRGSPKYKFFQQNFGSENLYLNLYLRRYTSVHLIHSQILQFFNSSYPVFFSSQSGWKPRITTNTRIQTRKHRPSTLYITSFRKITFDMGLDDPPYSGISFCHASIQCRFQSSSESKNILHR